MSILIGDRVKVIANFLLEGVATDPSTVTATVENPYGVLTTPSPSSDTTGEWTFTIDVDVAGEWDVQVNGTGVVYKTLQTGFRVDKPNIP